MKRGSRGDIRAHAAGQVVHDVYVTTMSEQGVDHMGADETCAACDEDGTASKGKRHGGDS